MANYTKFRTAISGFHRKDVVDYIESSSAEHQRQLRCLEDANKKLEAEKAAALEQVQQLQEQLAKVTCADCADNEQTPDADTLTEMELEAYRRAEATERASQLRAEKLRQKLTELCAAARSQYQASGDALQTLSGEAFSVLERMQQTLAELRVVFDETEEAFDEMELVSSDTI